jgi:hypothetical protein
MSRLKTARFRRVTIVALLLASIFLTNSPVPAFIFLLLLFGVWNAIYLYVVPRFRQIGGTAILVISVPVFLAGSAAAWVSILGLVLFLHGNWLAFTAAARLDE